MTRLASPRDEWCRSLPDRSLTTLREAAHGLTIEQLRPHGYDYCYLNLLSVFGGKYSTDHLSSLTAGCLRNYLFSGEEFHTYCLAARGKRPWDGEIKALNASIRLTARAKSILTGLLARGSVIACGFHWGAFRFIPVALSSLGFPVASILSAKVSDKYAPYAAFTDTEIKEARGRHVSEAFYGVTVVDTNRRAELLGCIKSLKTASGFLFVPVDGMFTSRPSPNSVSISFAGYTLQVKANPAALAAKLRAPLVTVFAERQNSGAITVDVADVIEPDSPQISMQRVYASLEERVRTSPDYWEGARTFHHLRKAPPLERWPTPSSEDLSAVRAAIEKGLLSLNPSRVACMQMPDGGQAWVDSHTLRCFGRTAETTRMLAAIQKRREVANLWREYRSDEERSGSLIRFLGQLRAEGLLDVGN